jgi:hypothetical protein
MKTPAKTPNNPQVSKMAALIVNKEISRMVGPNGALGLVRLGALLKLVHPLYRAYYDTVDKGEIHLDQVQQYFSPEAWALMTRPKRELLEAGIKKEVERIKKQIQAMMLVLHQNDTDLATLTGPGQAALELVMQELMGEPTPALVAAPVPAPARPPKDHYLAGVPHWFLDVEKLQRLVREQGRVAYLEQHELTQNNLFHVFPVQEFLHRDAANKWRLVLMDADGGWPEVNFDSLFRYRPDLHEGGDAYRWPYEPRVLIGEERFLCGMKGGQAA